MARTLTPAEIEKLASRKGVRRIAVENFLSTVDTEMRLGDHLRNLNADTRSYGWKAATRNAIEAGLVRMYKRV